MEELLTLAYALQVPPVLLFVPLDAAEQLQITSSVQKDVLDAAGWVAGDDGMTGILITESFAVGPGRMEVTKRTQDTRPLTLLRHMSSLTREIERLEPVRRSEDPQLAERAERLTRRYAEQLANQTGWLASLGFTPPDFPPQVAEFIRTSVVARSVLPPDVDGAPDVDDRDAESGA